MTRSPRFPLETFGVDHKDFSDTIAFDDHKIAYTLGHCSGRSVLDIGCVNHNPQNYKSRDWVHKATTAVSKDVLGLDDSTEGVSYLTSLGYNIVAADAQTFNLGRRFEVIAADRISSSIRSILMVFYAPACSTWYLTAACFSPAPIPGIGKTQQGQCCTPR